MKAAAIARAAQAKQASDIVAMDMRSVSTVTDFFIVASGSSGTHLRAIAESIDEQLAGRGVELWHREGLREAVWVLLDYGDVVAHLFYPSARRFYDLERLWGDAPRVDPFQEPADGR